MDSVDVCGLLDEWIHINRLTNHHRLYPGNEINEKNIRNPEEFNSNGCHLRKYLHCHLIECLQFPVRIHRVNFSA